MKAKFKCIFLRKICPFISVFCILCSFFSFSTFADTATTKVFSINRPYTSSSSCYLEIVTNSGVAYVLCVYFRAQTTGGKIDMDNNNYLTSEYGYVTFEASFDSGNLWVTYYNPPIFSYNVEALTATLFDQSGNSNLPVTHDVDNNRIGIYVADYISIVPYNCRGSFRSNGMTFIYGGNSSQEQTDQIINGYTPPEDSTPDTGSMDEAESEESTIRDNAAGGFTALDDLFDNFDVESEGNVAKGLLACTTIVNEFLGISDMDKIVNFSLVLGVIAFVLGSAVVLGAFGRRHNVEDPSFSLHHAVWYGSKGDDL